MKRKAINKETRVLVWEKYGRRCAYCGCGLEYKDMQVDHLVPIARSHQEPDKDPNGLENLMPSCRSCNYYKSTLRLDKFRYAMGGVHDRLQTGSAKFLVKLAIRYGIIEVKPFSGKFYFEEQSND
jgi:5-methylcytosine-specific restriction endonuclease McrA